MVKTTIIRRLEETVSRLEKRLKELEEKEKEEFESWKDDLRRAMMVPVHCKNIATSLMLGFPF